VKIFPSERARQRADTRTVVGFFGVMAVITLAFAVIVAVHYLLAWW
jgi:nitrogen fixation protein FixH